jgi:hypothetical protein
MFKKLFKSKKENAATKVKVEKLDKNLLKNTVGGGTPSVPSLDGAAKDPAKM